MQNQYLISFCLILILIPSIGSMVFGRVPEMFSGPPISTEGSSILTCTADSCVNSLLYNENGSTRTQYVILSRSKNELIVKWNKPHGNLIINNLTLSFVMKGCDSVVSNCSVQTYPAEVYVWGDYSWILLKQESLSNYENTYYYVVTNKMRLDNGQYLAKIVNNGLKPTNYIFIDQAELNMHYENLDKVNENPTHKILNFFKENMLFWRRIGIGIAIFIFILILIFTFRKNEKIKSLFKFDKKGAVEDKELNMKLREYKDLKNNLETLNRKLRAIEDSRRETQKKYYRRALDENTFKQLMRTYKQARIELVNEINGLKKSVDRYS